MDERIQQLIEETKEKFGLDDYYLQRHRLEQHVNILGETNYFLSMEWFPSHADEQAEDELNPDGAAIVEINVHNGRTESIIFVGGITYANRIFFSTSNEMISYIERETGLMQKEDFDVHTEDSTGVYVIGSHNGIPIYPRASIELKVDRKGHLIQFSKLGYFPKKSMFLDEPYQLSLDKITDYIRQQITRVDWPNYETEEMHEMYGIEEIFIRNDQSKTLPFEVIEFPQSYVPIDLQMDWSEPIEEEFDRQEIDWSEEILTEDAFARTPSPDEQEITKEEVATCTEAVRTFLRKVYGNEQREWMLTLFSRERGYIQAQLRKNETNHRMFARKLVVFIDAETYEAVNYMDNELMIKAMDAFKQPDSVKYSMEDAYKMLYDHTELTPYYVYDKEKNYYVLCGKLDCQYGVHAHSGELMHMED